MALIPAAGAGRRMNAGTNKIWLPLGGQSIAARTLDTFQRSKLISNIVLVVNEEEKEEIGRLVEPIATPGKEILLVTGGIERQDSVGNGLQFLKKWNGWKARRKLVVIHDAARALLSQDLLETAIKAALNFHAIGVGVPVKDTIKKVDQEGFVELTPDRSLLWAIQTPQVFDFDLISGCYDKVFGLDLKFSDDCGVAEYCGYRVKMVYGSYENLKITTPEDLVFAEAILGLRCSKENFRDPIRF